MSDTNTDPLPIAVEICNGLGVARDYSLSEADDTRFRSSVIWVDVRIRPLVEALLVAVEHMHADRGLDGEADDMALDAYNAAMKIVDDALKAAQGAE